MRKFGGELRSLTQRQTAGISLAAFGFLSPSVERMESNSMLLLEPWPSGGSPGTTTRPAGSSTGPGLLELESQSSPCLRINFQLLLPVVPRVQQWEARGSYQCRRDFGGRPSLPPLASPASRRGPGGRVRSIPCDAALGFLSGRAPRPP